jgi:hypothetical protein
VQLRSQVRAGRYADFKASQPPPKPREPYGWSYWHGFHRNPDAGWKEEMGEQEELDLLHLALQVPVDSAPNPFSCHRRSEANMMSFLPLGSTPLHATSILCLTAAEAAMQSQWWGTVWVAILLVLEPAATRHWLNMGHAGSRMLQTCCTRAEA